MVRTPRRPNATFAILFATSCAACAGGGEPPGEDAGEAAGGSSDTASVATSGPTPGARCEELGAILRGAASASGDVCRVAFPRGDLSVTLLGANLPAGMGLTSWAAFAPAGSRGSIVMGDLALTAMELPPVMAGLRRNGIRTTAVHRHMSGDRPAMSFMHYLGIGASDSLARGLAAALDAAPSARGGARDEEGAGTAVGSEPGIVAGASCDDIARTLGADPESADRGPGYCKVSLPRADLDVRVDGRSVPATLGIGSWFAFQQTRDGAEAVIAGDMALTEEQVNPAIGALREAGIDVVALHNHMLFDEPRVVFFHFQARGAPDELARGLAAGLRAAGLGGSGTAGAGDGEP